VLRARIPRGKTIQYLMLRFLTLTLIFLIQVLLILPKIWVLFLRILRRLLFLPLIRRPLRQRRHLRHLRQLRHLHQLRPSLDYREVFVNRKSIPMVLYDMVCLLLQENLTLFQKLLKMCVGVML
jgi:hypothetical protein